MATPNDNKLGQYELLEKIAQGGMAEVYKAKTRDTQGIERLVVIKRILPHIATHPEYIEMLIDEAKIAVHFTHGNIAQIYDLGRVGDDYFIVMEYVDGKTLSQIFRALNEREKRMPIDILLYTMIELCHGLSYIHRKKGLGGVPLGVVHRDISPQNIILSYSGNVKIIDFGVARSDFVEGKTEDGVLKGKFAYMSPEQTKGGDIDYRSDIFSTGILLWELATGGRLFKRKIHKDTVKAVQKAKFDLPSALRSDLPKGLDAIVKRALAKSAKARYQDAIEMSEELEKLLFQINPQVRPVDAAKFVFKLFGPEDDEEELSQSDLSGTTNSAALKSAPEPDEKTPFDAVKRPAAVAKDAGWEEPTHRDGTHKDKTPLVRFRLPFAINSTTKYFLAMLLIFILGTVYTVFSHLSGSKSHIDLTGVTENTLITLDGIALASSEINEIPVTPDVSHTLTAHKKGFHDKTIRFQLAPGDHKTFDVSLEKMSNQGDLVIVTTPQGATVSLNGQKQAQKTPLTIRGLNAGEKFSITVELNHYKPITQDVQVAPEKETKIVLPLEFELTELLVTSEPSAALVFIDGKEMGTTPYYTNTLTSERKHSITVVKENFLPQTQILSDEIAKTGSLNFILESRSQP